MTTAAETPHLTGKRKRAEARRIETQIRPLSAIVEVVEDAATRTEMLTHLESLEKQLAEMRRAAGENNNPFWP